MGGHGNDIFKEAYEEFLGSLSPNEQPIFKRCLSADDLVAEVKNLEVIEESRIRGRGFLARIEAFSDRLQPYFEVINIVIQSHPQCAALVWGALRLVLMLASNIATFFEKLTQTLDRLAKELPQYVLIVQLYETTPSTVFSDRIKTSVKQVYADLFKFFQSVTRIFTKKDGSMKSRPLVISDLFWRPYDVRFQDLLEQMAFHCAVVKDEVRIAGMRADAHERIEAEEERKLAADERAQAELERLRALDSRREISRNQNMAEEARNLQDHRNKASLLETMRRWLDPPEFAREFERACDSREDGTSTWLIDDPVFERWTYPPPTERTFMKSKSQTFDHNALWIRGNPGCGKTVLAAATIENLKSIFGNGPSAVCDIYYFFFRTGSSSLDSIAAAHRALLAQILQACQFNKDVIDMFQFTMSITSSGQKVASNHELRDLLQICTRKLGDCIFILDAIDECSNSTDVVKYFLEISNIPSVKVLMFSRPAGYCVSPLLKAFPEDCRFDIGKSTSNDIRLFFTRRLGDFLEDGLLEPNVDREDLVNHLTKGADGMFLWAQLMITYLRSPVFTSNQRRNKIKAVLLPEKLDKMYDRIVTLIWQGSAAERELAQELFLWLLFSKRTLTVSELQEAVMANKKPDSRDDRQHPVTFGRTVVSVCASLVEKETSAANAQDHTFRFIHLSAKEYFLQREQCHRTHNTARHTVEPYFFYCPLESHSKITQACLSFLKFALPIQQLSGDGGLAASNQEVNSAFPFCKYAATTWIDHLCETIGNLPPPGEVQEVEKHITEELPKLTQALGNFLSQGFLLMAWTEMCYIFGEPPRSRQLQRWSRWILSALESPIPNSYLRTLEDTLDFGIYLGRLESLWGDNLRVHPHCIWEEVTAFTPSPLLPQNSGFTVKTLAHGELDRKETRVRYLCKIVEVDQIENTMGILSIFPSRFYEISSEKVPSKLPLAGLRQASAGWVARYEVLYLEDSPRAILDLQISLDPEHIWLQLVQSLSLDGGWSQHFPMSISSNLHSFTILRSLYTITQDQSGENFRLESSLLPLESQRFFQRYWSPQSGAFKRYFKEYIEKDHPRNTYTYWIFFSLDRKYLFFADQYETRNNLLVFKLEDSDGIKASLLASERTNGLCGVGNFTSFKEELFPPRANFRSERPLLAVIGKFSVYLWALDSAKLLRMEGVKDIQFSSCGKLLVTKRSSMHPEIQPLPEEFLQSSADRLVGLTHQRWPCTELTTSRKSLPQASNFNHVPRQHLGPNPTYEIVQGVSIATSTSLTNGNVNIHRQKPNSNSTMFSESVEILKLPRYPGKERTTATVLLPKSKADAITVVLSEEIRPWYSMREANEHLPAVINRDQRSLGPQLALGLKRVREIEEDSIESDYPDEAGQAYEDLVRAKHNLIKMNSMVSAANRASLSKRQRLEISHKSHEA